MGKVMVINSREEEKDTITLALKKIGFDKIMFF